MSVALLPCYENVGSAQGDESNHIKDVWLYRSLESLSLLEDMNKDCEFGRCTKADSSLGRILVPREKQQTMINSTDPAVSFEKIKREI